MTKRLYYLLLCLSLFVVSCGTTKQAFDPERKYAPAVLQDDYHLFRHILEDLHPSLYWYTSRDSMNFYFDKGYAAITDSMTEPQFRTLLSYVIAKVNCGHTSVRASKAYSHYLDTVKLPQFPLILKCWKDTMVVSANLNRKDSILKRGVIIRSINGWNTTQLTDTLFKYFASDGYNLTGKYQYLSTGFNFSWWYKQVIGDTSAFHISYLDNARQLRETVIARYDPRADTFRRARPFHTSDSVRRSDVAREPGRKERRRREEFLTRNLQLDSANTTGFMTLNTFEHGNRLRRFFRQSFRTLSEKHVQNLVIDVRINGGGDATNSTRLTRYIIDKDFRVADSLYTLRRHSKYDKYIENSFLYRMLMDVVSRRQHDGKYHFGYFERHVFSPFKKHHFNGQVYILTGGNSFSATCLFAGALKGQKNVTIVGEETGGGYYGNTAWMIPNVTLPGTGLRFRLPRFRLVVDKDRDKDGRGVLPDVTALPTSDAISRGLDFKTAKARELIQLHITTGKK
ncbi:MAG: S41 family peptidase [Chitinophagaceae bacterium]|nr:S41 family peptidase [Chitinophagaceae bacterium]